MPFKILLFLSITLLAACTAQPSTTSPANATLSLTEAPAPIAPTATTVEITPTPVPPTPTNMPTEIPATPTETRDPNMPDDATGKDAQGNYIKTVTENGKQVIYTSEAVQIGSNGETKNMWVTSHVINPTFNGGIPLIDQPADGFTPIISIHFDVKEGIQAPLIQHTENLASSSSLNFSRLFDTTLMERYFWKSILKISIDDMKQYYKDLYAGKISIPVTDANGNTYDLPINDNTRANIILVNPEDITTSDYQDKFINSTTTFKNGVLTITVASTTPPKSLSKSDFTYVILSQLMSIFTYQDQSMKFFHNNPGIGQRVDQLDNLAINGQNPLFTIVTP